LQQIRIKGESRGVSFGFSLFESFYSGTAERARRIYG